MKNNSLGLSSLQSRIVTGINHFFSVLTLVIVSVVLVMPPPKASALTSNCLSTNTAGSSNDLIVGNGESVTLDGTIYCDEVDIQAGGTLFITAYDGTGTKGTLIIYANSINVAGTIDGDGRGYTGGNGGTGGAGGNGGAGAPAGQLAGSAGSVGSNGSSGSSGSGSASGPGSSGGNGTTSVGNGGATGGIAGTNTNSGGRGGSITGSTVGSSGNDGGYAVVGANGDSSTDSSVLIGSGGGGGGGGGGGSGGGGGGSTAVDPGGAGGSGSSGGTGGNGGAGGASLKLIASGSIYVTGSITLKGSAGSAGAISSAGSNGTAGTDCPGTGGSGGAAGGNTGNNGGFCNISGNGGAGGGGGASGRNGGTGGDGGGGGLFLHSVGSSVSLSGASTIDLRGGNVAATGINSGQPSGTAKVFYATSFTNSGSMNAGRLYANQPPSDTGTPTVTSPTTDTTPTFSWAAATDDTGVDHYEASWSQDSGFTSGVVSTTTTSTNCSISTTNCGGATGVSNGTWYFRVRAVDGSGGTSANYSTASVTIDNVSPTVPSSPTITSPTSDNAPSFSWTASTDATSGVASYQVQWSQQSDFSGTVYSGSVNHPTVSCTLSKTNACSGAGAALDDGIWYVRVRAVDAVGNQSAYTSNSSVEIDTTSPTAPGTPSTTSPTTDTTPSWTWTASTDSGSGLRPTNTYEVQWCTDSGFSGCGANTAFSNTASYTHTVALADGTWYFRVRAYDLLDQPSSYSSNGSVTIDSTAPSVPGTPTTTTPTTDTTPTWTWTDTTDSGQGLRDDNTYEVQWCTNSSFTGCGSNLDSTASATDPDPASYTHNTGLTVGTWYFRVRAVDALGNTSAYSSFGTVVINASSDTTPPSQPGTPSSTTPSTDTTPTISWTGSTDDTAVDYYQVQWSQSPTFASGVITGTVNHPTVSCTLSTSSCGGPSGLADGVWYIRIMAFDQAGNSSSFSSYGSVEIDTTSPTAPGTPSTTSPTTNTTPTWTWTASTDSGSGLRPTNTYEVQWCTDSSFGGGCTNSAFTNTNSYTHTTPLVEGTWYFRLRAYDETDNISSYSSNGSIILQSEAEEEPDETEEEPKQTEKPSETEGPTTVEDETPTKKKEEPIINEDPVIDIDQPLSSLPETEPKDSNLILRLQLASAIILTIFLAVAAFYPIIKHHKHL